MEENIRVLFKPVGRPWDVRTIRNSWEDLHDLVEGFIEYVRIADHLSLVVNDCGVINDMPLNFKCGPHMIFGPAVLVGTDGPETTSCWIGPGDLNLHMVPTFNIKALPAFEEMQSTIRDVAGPAPYPFDDPDHAVEDPGEEVQS